MNGEDGIKNLQAAASGLLEAFGQAATDDVAKANAMTFISSTFNSLTSWSSEAISSLTHNIKGVSDGSYTEESLHADLDAYLKEKGFADENGTVDMNSLDGEKLAGFMAQVGTPLPAQVLAGAIGIDIESTASNIFARLKNLANDAAGIKGAPPKQEAPKGEFNLLTALMNRDFGAIGGEIKSWLSDITSLLGTAKTAASAWGGEIGGTVNSFIDTISGALSSIVPNIGGMLGKFIPDFSFSDDAPQDDGPTAEEKAVLLAKEQAAEAERQQALAREQEQQRQQQDIVSSPGSSKEDFANAHDDKQTPLEVEEQLIASNPALKNVLNSRI